MYGLGDRIKYGENNPNINTQPITLIYVHNAQSY